MQTEEKVRHEIKFQGASGYIIISWEAKSGFFANEARTYTINPSQMSGTMAIY